MKKRITLNALEQRLRRKLWKEDIKLCKSRGHFISPWGKVYGDLGQYCTVNAINNWLIDQDIDIEDFGRDYGVLAEGEKVIYD